MRYLPFVAVIGVLALTTSDAAAQSVSRDPTYGSVSLDEGFLPDPHVSRLTAGGSIDVSVGSCSYGYVADAPDVDVYYSTSGRATLYFYVESDIDVTLLINTPDGRWVCNDDGYTGANPIVELSGARGGLYNVWVGTYGSSTGAATLYVSEINPLGGGGGGGARPQTPSRGQPDYTRRPTFETAYLDAGFLPDPYIVDMTAGGPIDVDIPGVCSVGYVATAPDVDLQYSARGRTDLYIYSEASSDITLLINTPDGRWLCNDDGHTGVNPLLEIPNARSGLYNIWVGSYGTNEVDASLFISEIHPEDNSGRQQSMRGAPDLSMSPTYGTIRLDQGFLPDPYIDNLTAGGNIDVDIPGVCSTGYVANAPDFNLQYSARSSGKGRGGGGSANLYVYAEANSDITLLINTPDGRWECNDDGWEGLNPLIAMPRADGGLYNIWVGSYGTSNVNATLYITEIDPR